MNLASYLTLIQGYRRNIQSCSQAILPAPDRELLCQDWKTAAWGVHSDDWEKRDWIHTGTLPLPLARASNTAFLCANIYSIYTYMYIYRGSRKCTTSSPCNAMMLWYLMAKRFGASSALQKTNTSTFRVTITLAAFLLNLIMLLIMWRIITNITFLILCRLFWR